MKIFKLTLLLSILAILFSCGSRSRLNDSLADEDAFYFDALFNDPFEGLDIVDEEEECPRGRLSMEISSYLAAHQVVKLPLQTRLMAMRQDLEIAYRGRITEQTAALVGNILLDTGSIGYSSLSSRVDRDEEARRIYEEIIVDSSLLGLSRPASLYSSLPGRVVCMPRADKISYCAHDGLVQDLVLAINSDPPRCSDASTIVNQMAELDCLNMGLWGDYYSAYCEGSFPDAYVYIAEINLLGSFDECDDAKRVYEEVGEMYTQAERNQMKLILGRVCRISDD